LEAKASGRVLPVVYQSSVPNRGKLRLMDVDRQIVARALDGYSRAVFPHTALDRPATDKIIGTQYDTR